MVRIGDALGLYRALHTKGSMTCAELAQEVGVNQRYLREWLSQQAASNYLSYEPASGKFTLPPEQAMVFADEDSPVYMMGGFDLMASLIDAQPKVQDGVQDRPRRCAGTITPAACSAPWRGSSGLATTTTWSRTGCRRSMAWSRSCSAVRKVADVGCGHGWSTVLMAKAFPNSNFVGYDFHPSSIENARAHAQEHNVLANTRFEVAKAKEFPGTGFDLVTFFDCLHDMGDPAGAAAHVRQSLKPDGTWMIVEPMAGDRLEDNLNPVGRLYLRRFDHGLRADLAVAGGGRGTRRPGRGGETARGDLRRRLPQRAARDGDAVQHDPGGTALTLRRAGTAQAICVACVSPPGNVRRRAAGAGRRRRS